MKKKLLVAAMMAAGIGAAGTASAVHVNPDGLGQVLLYPYYTTEAGWVTNIKVVNTTSQVKAVKVRFLEGMNSREVLDFNLYLSPFDEWAGAVVNTASGAGLQTADTSCTAPKINGVVAFRNFEYVTDAAAFRGLDRTREGYVEIIEMANVISPTLAAAATHVSGTPADCPAIVTAANTAGLFNTSPATTLTAPTGGLYGIENLVNRDAGAATMVDAVALENFWVSVGLAAGPHHTPPGSLSPSLENVQTAADVFNPNVVPPAFVAFNSTTAVDNVSAILTHNTISNDYGIGADLLASTDWVVTFPTKRFYVNQIPARAPFQQTWDTTTATSCDPITISYFDREENTQDVGDDDFSPTPPVPGLALCHEVNTVSIVTKGDTDPGLFGAAFTNAKVELDAGFDYGWMRITFPGASAPGNAAIVSDGTTTINGLPVIGFAMTQFVNNALDVGGTTVLSNYGGSTVHKGTRLITPL